MEYALSTRLLAQQLGFIQKISIHNQEIWKRQCQFFDFLIILDFEATCWDKYDPGKRFSEIIEFPAVFYSVKQNKVLLQFQQYVRPTEQPILSNFCTKLTGITQYQVDTGVPLSICINLFSHWVCELINRFNLTFNVDHLDIKQKCALVTWSDWDLTTCLRDECERKGIPKSEIFNKWIDLRALYIEYYKRRPKGLNGALTEVGLAFQGREHCGLDDAKNTALLVMKMVSDGVLLRITRDLTAFL